MRRALSSLAAILTFAVVAGPASAQFRQPVRPMQAGIRPIQVQQRFVVANPFFANPTLTPTLTRATIGSFNPSTGAFMPGGSGNYFLAGRRPFQPVTGTFLPSTSGSFVVGTRQTYNPFTGTFVPSPTGNLVVNSRGDFVPTTGSFARTAQGTVNPRTGAFTPGTDGAYSISSRGLFVPTSGTFVPMPGGNFVLTAKQTFDPNTGSFVPSPTGQFHSRLQGAFLPGTVITNPANRNFNPSISVTTAPGNPIVTNPYIAWAQQLAAGYRAEGAAYNAATVWSVYANDPNRQLNSPWWPPPYYNPWYPIPYNQGYYGSAPYSMPYSNGYGGSGYGSPNGAPQQQAPVNIPVQQAQPMQPSPLAAFGIPSEDGAVKWPLAFRLMPPNQKRDLLDPLQSQLQIVTAQAAAGRANQALVKEARHKVESLHQWLRTRRLDMAEGTFNDGDAFIRQIDVALQAMRND
jgi:hypothetical protein